MLNCSDSLDFRGGNSLAAEKLLTKRTTVRSFFSMAAFMAKEVISFKVCSRTMLADEGRLASSCSRISDPLTWRGKLLLSNLGDF